MYNIVQITHVCGYMFVLKDYTTSESNQAFTTGISKGLLTTFRLQVTYEN